MDMFLRDVISPGEAVAEAITGNIAAVIAAVAAAAVIVLIILFRKKKNKKD